MANQATYSFSLSSAATTGSTQVGKYARSFNGVAAQSAAKYAANVMTVTTTAAALTIPTDVSTAGYSVFINTDTTNFVTIGVNVSSTFYPFAKLKPGEGCMLRLGTNTPYAKADTASILLEYGILSD